MEILLDGSSKTVRIETVEREQNHQTFNDENEEFHDAQEEKEQNKTQKPEWSKTQQKRQTRKLHTLRMRLQNQQNKNVKVQTKQVDEMGNDTFKEDDLQERENFTGKNEFLSWDGAHDCMKDKVMGNYA